METVYVSNSMIRERINDNINDSICEKKSTDNQGLGMKYEIRRYSISAS